MMFHRAYNFNAGPAALPLEVLEQAHAELIDYKGIGMSIMEISHRSKEYEQVNNETQQLFKQLMQLSDEYKVMFIQGGASTQFSMVPLNLLRPGCSANYVLTGTWAEKAIDEAKKVGDVRIVASGESSQFKMIPDMSQIEESLSPEAAYLHLTSNETVAGSQFKQFPRTHEVPLVVDMSSDILSRPLDFSQFSLIYAGAQKNLGPSGVTVVVIKESLLADVPDELPTMLRYATYAKNDSLYNTPPVYSVYMMNLVLKWIQEKGGLEAIEKMNNKKAQLIYNTIDGSQGFFEGLIDEGSRSHMNITFRVHDNALEKMFLQEAESNGFIGLKGHRSVGHVRASVYNALPYASCEALTDFMLDFQRRHG